MVSKRELQKLSLEELDSALQSMGAEKDKVVNEIRKEQRRYVEVRDQKLQEELNG